MAENKKFSLSMYFIKITSRAYKVWVVTTVIVCYVLYKILNAKEMPVYTWMPVLLAIWGGTALLFVGGNVLIDALGKMVEKANLTINQNNNVSANTQISGTVGGQK